MLLLLKKSELFSSGKLVTFQSCVLSFSFLYIFLSCQYVMKRKENLHSNDMLDIYFFLTKKWEMARWIIHNFYHTYISTTTKGILVYGIYAHFLWLCHYTHTFVIDNPIFTKKLFASREDVAIVDVDQSIIKFSLLKNKNVF